LAINLLGMKKIIVILAVTLISLSSMSQKLEFRLRGGVNFQRSSSTENEYSFLPHVGAMAGVRISIFGIYGELLYSKHDDQYWSEAAAYLVPSALFRFYGFRYFYSEAGLSYYILAEDKGLAFAAEYSDQTIGYFAGLGLYLNRLELGLRATAPVNSIQATASYLF
jgi:hypothetical protein